jgi:micrococcal nuclease
MFLVTEVIDGDTIRVKVRGKSESVRLLAIDTPETKDPRKPVQCFGNEATKKMQAFVSGKYVRLVDDKSQGNRENPRVPFYLARAGQEERCGQTHPGRD